MPMPAASPGPVIARVKLGLRLRRLREAAGVSAQQAAQAIGGSDSKISRIELGRHGARDIDVVDLLECYGVTDSAERDEVLALASQAGAPPWWQRHVQVLPAWFQAYLGLEQGAASVLSYDTHFVPGLLQTDGYARELLAAGGVGTDEADRLIAVHTERIARFAAGGWRLSAVIDEAVLHRQVGTEKQWRELLAHLREATTWPGVTVQVRPFAAGAPVAPAGFTILRFDAAELPDVVYTEQLTSASCLDRPADVARYARVMDLLRGGSYPAAQTAGLLDAALTRNGRLSR